MRLSIHGSRTLKDERVKVILLETVAKHGVTALVTHAEPGGVCEVGRALAKELALPLHLHFLDFSKQRGAWAHRSVAVLRDSDRAVFIHDGKSKGTTNEMALAVKYDHPHDYHVLKPAKGPSQSFEDDSDWAGVLSA